MAAYLPADAPAPLAGRIAEATGAPGDPAALIVPFCAAFALCFPAWGRLADRRDPRRVLATAFAGLAAAGVLLALADSEAIVLLARVLAGAAAAGLPPTGQAVLTRSGGTSRAGRAVGGMMIGVAIATLAGPPLAHGLAVTAGWRFSIIALCVLPATAVGVLVLRTEPLPAAGSVDVSVATRLGRPSPGLLAGWAVSALVLSAYWTVLTRADDLLAGAGSAGALLPLAGASGIPLVVLAARAADQRGTRAPMLVITCAGTLAFALAAAAPGPLLLVPATAAALALYWGYLPVVSAQVQRCAPAASRAQAAAWLYSSMWAGAAVGGALAALAPDPRWVLGGAAVAWAAAAVVAARRFEPAPA